MATSIKIKSSQGNLSDKDYGKMEYETILERMVKSSHSESSGKDNGNMEHQIILERIERKVYCSNGLNHVIWYVEIRQKWKVPE